MQESNSNHPSLSPCGWKTVSAIVFFGILLVGAVGYGIGRYQRAQQLAQTDFDCATYQTQTKFYSQKSQQYYEELTSFKRDYLVSQASLEELTESYNKLQNEMVDLREELLFYQQVVAPQKASGRIKLHEAKIQPLEEPGLYKFQVILVQTQKRKATLSGTVELSISGLADGASKTLTWKEISAENTVVPFSMKYFQTVTGKIRLPEGFEPQQLILQARLNTAGQKRPKPEVEKSFDWDKLR